MTSSRLLSSFLATSIFAVLFLLTLEIIRPRVLLVGNVTVDVVDGNRTVGGAISYAAAVLEAQGIKACVVTTAGADADLSIFAKHDLHVLPDNQTLTFAHSYTWWGHKRVLHVTARPSTTLDLKHVPFICRLAKTVLIMPLMPTDVNSASFLKWRRFQNRILPQQIGLAAQGYQRDTAADGRVFAYSTPHQLFLKSLGKGVSVFLSDVESDPWSREDLMKVVTSSDRVLITKGDKGAEEIIKAFPPAEIDVVKVEKVIDTNGAGDTFATAYMLAMAAGSAQPGLDASRAAAQVVTKPQSCKPWCIASDRSLANFITPHSDQDHWPFVSNFGLDWNKLGLFCTPAVLRNPTET